MRQFEELLYDFHNGTHLPDNELQHLSEGLYTIVSCLRDKGAMFLTAYIFAHEEYETTLATMDARGGL